MHRLNIFVLLLITSLSATLTGYGAPAINSLEVAPQPLVSGDAFTVTVDASDVNRVTATVDFRPTVNSLKRLTLTQGTGGLWTGTTTVPSGIEGQFEAQLKVFALNTATRQRAQVTQTLAGGAVVDLTPPTIEITAPANLSLFAEPSITVSGTASANTTQVTVNGDTAILNGTNWSIQTTLSEGVQTISAVARTAADVVASDSVQVTLDTEGPTVVIETPSSGVTVTSLQVDVAGLVNDIVSGTTINADDCRVFINGVEAAVANRSFVVPNFLLQRGRNTVTAEAIDRAGNRSETAIIVNVEDQAGQRLELISGNGQSTTVGTALSDPLIVALIDRNGDVVPGKPVNFNVTRGDGSVTAFPDIDTILTVLTDDNGLASVGFVVGNRAGAGNHRVTATAPGFIGQVDFCANAIQSAPTTIAAVSGDSQVGVVGEALPAPLRILVTDASGNPASNVDVTFTIEQGDGSFEGNTSLVLPTNLDGEAFAVLTLGSVAGLNNNVVSATFDSNEGAAASFAATANTSGDEADTTVSGLVVDNQNNPLQGVTLTIDVDNAVLNPVPTAITDAEGRFTITGAPVGAIHLHVDGSTTMRPGIWASLDFELVTIAGQDNSVDRPIYLLPLDVANGVAVGNNGPAEATTLQLDGVPGATLTLAPNSVTCPDGQSNCIVSVTQVNSDRVPMAPPLGSNFMLAWTIQPPGAHFDPPAQLCIPNSDMLPGTQVEIFSFDHDIGEFVAIGTATVSEDGSQICSDPGFGVVKGGWHGCVPPPPPGFDIDGDGIPDVDANGNPLPNNGNGGTRDQPGAGGTSGDPIIVGTGELIVTETDIHIPGRGFPFEFTRTYRSQYNLNGILGFNWDFNQHERLDIKPNGDVFRCSGRSRVDQYVRNPDGSYTSPPRFYDVLTANPDGTFTIRNREGFNTNYGTNGLMISRVDRNGNTMEYIYNNDDQLITVVDTMGRDIDFTYTLQGRISTITDFAGRVTTYEYDNRGDLVAVTTPSVTGTSNGNDFPNGKTTRYEYLHVFNPDLAPLFNPPPDPRLEFLNHNLISVTDAKGQRHLFNEYGTDPDSFNFDKIIRQQEGLPGQDYTYTYTELNPGGSNDPNVARNQTVEIDRAGNRTTFITNFAANVLEERIETNRNINSNDPAVFVTQHTYNTDGERTSTTFPEGNSILFEFDSTNPSRFQQGNMIAMTRLPGPRGGEQAQIRKTMIYEPVYNTLLSETEARGNDASFIPQNGGAQSAARYTKNFFFDYQEGNNLSFIANELRMTEPEAATLLANAGISLNLGDLNGDSITTQNAGNIVRKQEPTVTLPDGSSQDIFTEYAYNRFGQVVTEIDPEGNVDDFFYFPESDPDGDGTFSVSTRSLAGDTGGYLSAVLQDNRTSARRTSTATLTQIRTEKYYDSVGNVIRTVDGRGNDTLYEINQLNQLVRQTTEAPFRYEQVFFYDANNNIVREDVQNVDTNGPNLGAFTTYTYDYNILDFQISRTAAVSQSKDLVTTYEYDDNYNQIRIIQPEGNIIERVFDERDMLYQVTEGAGTADASTITNTYDGNQNLIIAVDAVDNNGDGVPEETNFFYDGFDRVISAIDAVGNETVHTYDPASNIIDTQRFGPNGGPSPTNDAGTGNVLLSRVELRFDELNRDYEASEFLFSNIAPVGPEGILTPGDGKVTSSIVFDRNNRRVLVSDDNDHRTQLEYDGAERLIRTVDAEGNETINTYDNNHNRTQQVKIERSPEGTVGDEVFVSQWAYDSLDRVTRMTDNVGNTMDYFYDSRNNKIRTVDALGNTKEYIFDGISRVLEERKVLRVGGLGGGAVDTSNPNNADGLITQSFIWDDNSRLGSVTDDKGNTTAYGYDALNRRITETYADNEVKTFTFDPDNNVTTYTDQNGSICNFTYDGINRLISKNVTRALGVDGTTLQTFEYDGLNRQTLATDNNNPTTTADDSVIEFQYDSLSRVLAEIQNGQTVSSIYDGVGNPLQLNYPNGRSIVRTYDDLNRTKTIADAGASSNIVEYDFMGPNRVLERRYINGTQLSFHDGSGNITGYDGVKRMIQRRNSVTSTGDLITSFNYAYDKMSNRRFEHDEVLGEADAYEYDSAYRLTRAVYTIDPADITGITNNATTNADVSALSGSFQVSYVMDGVDNFISENAGLATTNYVPNVMNEYASIDGVVQTHDDNGNLTDDGDKDYFYDHMNRLVRVEDTGSVVATYTYDGLGRRIQKAVGSLITNFFYSGPRVIEERDGSNTTTRQYVHGLQIDEVVEMTVGSTPYYYHSNSIGSIAAITDATGAVVERYTYDAYGRTTILDAIGTTVLPQSTVGNPYLFTGRRLDTETGLYYYRTRFYSPERGRFLQRDPLGYIDSMGLYTYVGNNPINWIDPYGSWKKALSLGLDFIPFVGTAKGVVELITGRDPITGEEIPRWQSALGLGASLIPGGKGAAKAATKYGDEIIGAAAKYGDDLVGAAGKYGDDVAGMAGKHGDDLAGAAAKHGDEGAGAKKCVRCFVAGTLVATATGFVEIESIELGQRVMTESVSLWNMATTDATSVDPETWRKVQILVPNEQVDGEWIQINALKPIEWINKYDIREGEWYNAQFDNWGVYGEFQVAAVEPCPMIEPGAGQVVITTFQHLDAKPKVELVFENSDEVITVTAEHPFFSATRNSWVQAEHLRAGEVLKTKDGGTITILDASFAPSVQPVYNLEIENDHNFYVSSELILCHNCGGDTPKKGDAPCFPEGTLVSTPSGYVEIQDIQQGDTVYAYNFETGQVVEREVLDTPGNGTRIWIDITTETELITSTRFHLFWVESHQEWIYAIDLEPGMVLRLQSGELVAIEDIVHRHVEERERTYNLRVAVDENFFVGYTQVLVHNGKTYITYTVPDSNYKGQTGTYSGMASGPDTMTPQQILDKRHSGTNSHPGHNFSDKPTLDKVSDSYEDIRGRESMLDEHYRNKGESTNLQRPMDPNRADGKYDTRRDAAKDKWGDVGDC